ncbi:MAG TPA: SRPBCC family protein [Gammaproteobacteria bacterium]
MFASLLLATVPAQSGEVLDVAVEHFEQRYVVEIDARFAATPERLRALLTDYAHLQRINDSIRRSEVIEINSPQHHCVLTEAEVCVAVFCKRITQVQDVAVLPDGNILASVRPTRSDFSYGIARWDFWEEPTGTRMRFRSEIEPAFWVPPLIGPWLIQRALQAETLKSVANLERLAEAHSPLQ